MKEFIEKLIGRLEEESDFFSGEPMGSLQKAYYCKGVEKAIEIVNQLAEEYKQDIETIDVSELFGKTEQGNDGWIPCSERLPSYDGSFICTAKGIEESLELIYSSWDNSWMDELDSEYEVIAWQPLPAPYQPKGE